MPALPTSDTGTNSADGGAPEGAASDKNPPLPPGIAVGCADLPAGLRRKRYFQRLQYLETEGTRFQLPKRKILERWRSETVASGQFGLHAPQEITDTPGPKGYPRSSRTFSREELWQAGGFRDTPVVRAAVTDIADRCAAVKADVVLFRTPADFVPSAGNRERMRAFFGDIAPQEHFGDTVRVWEPRGLWEPPVAARFAAELGLVYACDPLSNDPLIDDPLLWSQLPSDQAYFRITGLGRGRQRFDDYALEPLLELVEAYRRTWVVFAHDHKYPDAIRCHRLLATLTAE